MTEAGRRNAYAGEVTAHRQQHGVTNKLTDGSRRDSEDDEAEAAANDDDLRLTRRTAARCVCLQVLQSGAADIRRSVVTDGRLLMSCPVVQAPASGHFP